MKILQVPVADLSHDPANARKHPERNLDTIVASLRRLRHHAHGRRATGTQVLRDGDQ
jgi:hypothetical protein